MPGTGTTVVDFGSYPGKLDTSVAVTGQTGIVAGSLVEAWLRPDGTAAHSADEHIMAMTMLRIIAGNIVAGTGFTIYALAQDDSVSGVGGYDGQFRQVPRKISRMYGTFTVAWAWV